MPLTFIGLDHLFLLPLSLLGKLAKFFLAHRFWLFCSLLYLLNTTSLLRTDTLFAQSPNSSKLMKADTTPRQTAVVQVTGQRPRLQQRLLNHGLSSLDSTELRSLQTKHCVDLLHLIPGVYVQDYGGIGGIKTVSLRGASASQTAVSLDGVRLNSSQNALFDFAMLPSSMISSVYVNDGAQLSASPANAMGGEILLRSPEPGADQMLTRIQLQAGSWNSQNLGAEVQSQLAEGHSLSASVSLERSDGNYPFQFNNFGSTTEYQRANADASAYYSSLHYRIKAKTLQSSTKLFARSSVRGAPGAVMQGNIQGSTARLKDKDILCIQTVELEPADHWELRSSVYGRFGQQSYSDTSRSILGKTFDDRFFARDAGFNLRLVQRGQSGEVWTLQSDLGYADLRGDLLRFNAGSAAHRSLAGVGASWQSQAVQLIDSTLLHAFAAFRSDFSSDSKPQLNPRVGLLFDFLSGMELSLHAGTAYRLPSFNELYYQNYGSTDLVPEQSSTIKASAELPFLEGAELGIAISSSVFYSIVTDQIISVPRSPVSWSAQNIARVRSQGFDLGCRMRLSALSIRASFSQQDVRDARESSAWYNKRVPYTPSFLAFVHTSFKHQNFEESFSVQWVSDRYTQSDNAPESQLPSVATLNASVSANTNWGSSTLRFSIRADNILNVGYVLVANYPMPGRQIHLGCILSLGASSTQ